MKITEQKPNLRLNSFIPNNRISGINPTMEVKSFIPKAKIDKSPSGTYNITTSVGTPIGLLLALTREITTTTSYTSSGISPIVKIITY